MTGVVDADPVAAPLRAVDRWRAERTGDQVRVHAVVEVRGDDPALRGHFPGLVIFPGVYVIEALCQVMVRLGPSAGAGSPVLRTLRSVRFFAPLLDGDELTLVVDGTAAPGGSWVVRAEGMRRDGSKAALIRAVFDTAGGSDA